MAEGINGYVEYNYNTLDSTITDSTGVSSDSTSSNFLQRYNLTMEKMIYPYLKLRAGGLFEKTLTDTKFDEQETRSTLTRSSPSVDLTLNNPFMTAGIGYHQLQQKGETGGLPSQTLIRDTYNAVFGLRPEGLPTLDALFLRTNTHDRTRALLNNESTYFLLGSRYRPVNELDLQYQFTSNDARNLLTDVDVNVLTHSGMATYTNQFFDKRVSLYARYNIAVQETDISGRSVGTIHVQVFPFSGLSGITLFTEVDKLTTVTLTSNPALINGDLTAPTDVNIGQRFSAAIPPDNAFRQMGLDFVNPTAVDTLYVVVDRDIPGALAGSFAWRIFTSTDNKTWVEVPTISGAPFNNLEHRFELKFTRVTTQYIKVVTQPLTGVSSPTDNVQDIFVTELQALTPATSEKTTRTTHIFDLNTKVKLLDNPYLYYDFYYWYTRTDPNGFSRYILSNGLSASKTFNRIFSGSARFAREDSEEQAGKRVAYVYSASLTAVPVPPLLHNVILSGRTETINGKSTDTKSLFLNNSAELYRGVNVNLSAGVSAAVSELDQETDSTIVNLGVSLIPHPAMTLTLNYSGNDIKQTGGGKQDFSTSSNRTDLTVAYTPWNTVYLFLSFGAVSEKNRSTNTVTNYALTWSPLPGGTLQFNFAYNENLTSADNGKETIITPSVRWNIIPRTYLDLSYLILKTENISQSSEAKSLNMNLKMHF